MLKNPIKFKTLSFANISFMKRWNPFTRIIFIHKWAQSDYRPREIHIPQWVAFGIILTFERYQNCKFRFGNDKLEDQSNMADGKRGLEDLLVADVTETHSLNWIRMSYYPDEWKE